MKELTENGEYQNLGFAYADYFVRLKARDYSPGELAQEIGVSKQLCSKVIGKLESRGYLRRRPNPADSRSSLLSLTAKGHRLNRDGALAADVTLQRLEESIGTDVAQRITEILGKLCRNLQIPLSDIPEEMAPRRLTHTITLFYDWLFGTYDTGSGGGKSKKVVKTRVAAPAASAHTATAEA